MSTDDLQKGKGTPPNMAVIMTFLVALIVIFTALLINFSDPRNPWLTNFSTSASTVLPSPLSATSPAMVSVDLPTTSEETLSPTVQTIDQYFRYINLAKSSEDLGKAWEMMTIKSKCNPADRCNFVQFQDFWWNFRVEYKLYDCGLNTVDSEVIYYARKSAGPIRSVRAEYIKYQLIDENGQLRLDGGELIEQIGANCKLSISVP